MPLSVAEFLKAVERDKELLNSNTAPFGVITCKRCGVPLQESVTGNRPDQTCSDCYFEQFGEELDKHPIALLRVTRGN
jgi:hypothetical protein